VTLNDVLTSCYCSIRRQGRAEVEKLVHGMRDQIKSFMALVHEEVCYVFRSTFSREISTCILVEVCRYQFVSEDGVEHLLCLFHRFVVYNTDYQYNTWTPRGFPYFRSNRRRSHYFCFYKEQLVTLNDVLTSCYCSIRRQGRAEVEKLVHGMRDQIKLFMALVHEEVCCVFRSTFSREISTCILI
jgi:hypothetical protein